jgi:hypothetical protein
LVLRKALHGTTFAPRHAREALVVTVDPPGITYSDHATIMLIERNISREWAAA